MRIIAKLFGSRALRLIPPLKRPAPESPCAALKAGVSETIAGAIDLIAECMGPEALERTTVVLRRGGEVSIACSNATFEPSPDTMSYFPLAGYSKIQLLKNAASRPDETSRMRVGLAGQEILIALKKATPAQTLSDSGTTGLSYLP